MKKNIVLLFLCCFGIFSIKSYIDFHVKDVQKQSDSGSAISATNKDLRGAQLLNLQAEDGDFRQTKAQPCEQNDDNSTLGVCIPGQTTNMSSGVFTRANFTNSVFRYVDFAGAKFNNVTAYNTDFSGSYFVGADFTGIKVVNNDAALAMANLSAESDEVAMTQDDLDSADPEDVALLTSTAFCNAIMPDGTKCTSDLSVWKDASTGQVIACGCDLLNGESNSENS